MMPWPPSWPHVALGVIASALVFALHLLVMARAITRPGRAPASRVAWVAAIGFLPILGMLGYLLLGETSIGRRRLQRLRQVEATLPLPPGLPAPAAAADSASAEAASTASLFALAGSINGFSATFGNRVQLLGDPAASADNPMADCKAAIATLVHDIDTAREQVHLCFYIWLDDVLGGRVADAVCAAAQRGVHCRVLVDALGSRAFVHGRRWQQLRQAGVQVHAMLDDVPRLGRWAIGRIDLRNHRKLAIIDGRIAYCGSQNCADPEFRVKPAFAPWIDLLLRCEGPVVRQAQWLFLSAWSSETGERLDACINALPEPERIDAGAQALMFGTGPSTAHNAMSDIFVAAIAAARHDVLITTPYFVPDEALLRALCAAPRRGVATTLVLPARIDSWLVAQACRSTWAELLACGVAVHEYLPGLLHAKSITIDAHMALVGSANMDRRSLELNEENNLLLVDRETALAIHSRQLVYLSRSRPVRPETVAAWRWPTRLVQNAVGMMAPVL